MTLLEVGMEYNQKLVPRMQSLRKKKKKKRPVKVYSIGYSKTVNLHNKMISGVPNSQAGMVLQ